MNNIPSSPDPASNLAAWMQAVKIVAGHPWQPIDKWVDEAALKRSKPLKNYYKLINRVYRFERSSFLAELYPSPVDLLNAIATKFAEEDQALRANDEFPGRRSYTDGGRKITGYLKSDLRNEPPPPPEMPPWPETYLPPWREKPYACLLVWAKNLSQSDPELYEILDKVTSDNKTETHNVRKMDAWGKAGRKPRKKRT